MRKHRVLPFLIIGLLALASAGVLATLQTEKKNTMTSVDNDTPTPITPGVMTARERELGSIYDKEYEWRSGRKLTQFPGTQEAQVILAPPSVPSFHGEKTLSASEFLEDMLCESDAVIVGEVTSKASQLTQNETFTFTQYEMKVEEVIKNNDLASIQPSSAITVTRPGGTIKLNGRVIRVTDMSFPLLTIEHKYLLFLRYIPTTSAYKTFRFKGDFELNTDKFTPLTKQSIPDELLSGDKTMLLIKAREVASKDCGSRQAKQKE